MSVSQDIVATYRGPGAVIRRLLARGTREATVLAYGMGACAIMFVAQWPRLARDAHLQDLDLNMEMGGALLGTVFMLPLVLYALAGLVHLVLGLLTKRGSGIGSRLALFWALFAAVPVALLSGLTAGFVGPGPALNAVGILWAVLFFWFWISGLRVVYGAGE